MKTVKTAQEIDASRLYFSFLELPFSESMAKEYLADEEKVVQNLLNSYDRHYSHHEIATLAKQLIQFSRDNHSPLGLELLLQEYPLSSTEGLVLMSLAEALLRIPDKKTAILLTREQFNLGHWIKHIAHNESWFVNLSTWGVLLSNKLFEASEQTAENLLSKMTLRLGEQTIISAIQFVVSLLSKQFVLAETIDEALTNSNHCIAQGYYFSYDMLGEEAVTAEEAQIYYEKYRHAIIRLGETGAAEEFSASISIKLSALHPRFEYRQKERVYKEIFTQLMQLCLLAKEHHVAITIDAEEVARFEMTLVLLQMLLSQAELKGWKQLGIAVQAYQKRAILVIEHLLTLAKSYHTVIPVRLVKGAYWDFEIKNAQQKGLSDFPVFTEKNNTELCYLHCIEKLFSNKHYFFPQFATHNSQTIAAVYYYAQKYNAHNFEFQRLYGMGNMVYDGLYHLAENMGLKKIPCRIYAPVGQQKTLLPYLVRRLLENGANNSFVNQLHNPEISSDELIINLRDCYKKNTSYRNPKIPRAINLYSDRINSNGFNLESSYDLLLLSQHLSPFLNKKWHAKPLLGDREATLNDDHDVLTEHHNPVENQNIISAISSSINKNPASLKVIGQTLAASEHDCIMAMNIARESFYLNRMQAVGERVKALHKMAELLEYNRYELMVLLIQEAGKNISDAQDELRESIDFCRYYANCAVNDFASAQKLESCTGEENKLLWQGRGIFLCISPWNFPLSIFIGQLSAALAAGNSVIAKPSSSTPLIACKVTELMYLAGFSKTQLQCLPAPASVIEKILLPHPDLAGVAFTGSLSAAKRINQILSAREGGIIPLIAETGGVNVMMTDSSALPEQLVKDILVSAFGCAGQRCSALRVAYFQDDVYDLILKQLAGAMQELIVSDPLELATDIGPLINSRSVIKVNEHIEQMREKGFHVICHGHFNLSDACDIKQFILPTVIEVNSLSDVPGEIFGPVLHVIKYQANELDEVMAQINHSGYGLTFGIHSRIPSRMEKLARDSCSGNVYINRNMVGAVVGVQPFGGQGLSGTGPKAGGPNYLKRFAREKTISLNTVSIGGNVQLFN